MSRTLDARRHEALRAFLVERRKIAGLRQVDLAKRLGRTQSYVSNIEIRTKAHGSDRTDRMGRSDRLRPGKGDQEVAKIM